MSDCRFVNASKDFFLSAMVNDDDRDAGLPKYKRNAIIQMHWIEIQTRINKSVLPLLQFLDFTVNT